MRRLILSITAGLLFLGAGVAYANFGFGDSNGSTVKAVLGTFSTGAATNPSTQTCTGTDNLTYTVTRATYTGTAPSGSGVDPSLTGNVTINALSVINSAGVGTVKGTIQIDTSSSAHTTLGFATVYSSGAIAGLAAGRTSAGDGLLGNVSATFNATSGFSNGKIGGTSGGNAVLLSRGGCTTSGSTSTTTTTTSHTDDDDDNGDFGFKGFGDRLRQKIQQQIDAALQNSDFSFHSRHH
jgi:hypothetical protein